MTDARALAIAHTERQLAVFHAADEEAARTAAAPSPRPARPPRARRTRGDGSSVVFSVRLDPDDLAALEARAARSGVAPSVLARNLIRVGLTPRSAELGTAIARAESALAEVARALQGAPAR